MVPQHQTDRIIALVIVAVLAAAFWPSLSALREGRPGPALVAGGASLVTLAVIVLVRRRKGR